MSDSDQIIFDKVEKMECPSCHAEVDVSALEAFSAAACPACGAALAVPARISTYRLLSCLGSGGMGSVYRAYDETLARVVAVKVMRKSLGEQPEFIESFRREAQAAAKLNHPNIAQIYSFGQEQGQPYIVMEFVPGKHLDKMIESPDMLSQPMVMKIGMDIADGLQLAAASNLIHGDIKPENILLDDREVAKLVDFGIASSPDAETKEIWGTPYYISPEKIKREKIDFRSDMYCLGGTLYHAITKHPPFDGEDAMAVVKARLAGPPRPMRDFRPDVDKEVEDIILRMLQLDPAMRYPNYGSLMNDIRQYLGKVQPQQVTAGSGGASKRIIIKGRGARARMPSAAPAGAADQPSSTASLPLPSPTAGSAPSRGGIRINKRGKSPVLNSAEQVPAQAVDEAAAAEAERKRKAKVVKAVMFSILGVVALLALAGVGLYLHFQGAKKAAAAAQADLIASQGRKLAPIATIYGNTQKCRDNLAEIAAKADDIVKQAVAAVETEVGVEFTSRIMQEDVEVEEPFDDAIEGDLRGAGGDEEEETAGEEEAAEEGEATEGEAAEGEDAEGEATEGEAAEGEATEGEAAEGEAAAEGESTAEEGEGSGEESAAEEGAAEEGTSGEDAAEGEGGEETAGELEGLPAMAREIFVMLAPVRKATRLAERTCASVEGLYNRAVGSTNVAATVMKEIEAEVGENLETIEKITAKASLRYGDLEDAVKPLAKLVKDAQSKLNDLSVEAKKLAVERERIAAEEKAAEEARVAREKKEAEEAARKAAEEAEIQKVRGVVQANVSKLQEHKYDAVLRELDELDGTLQFKTAQKALKAELRRVQGLKDLKDFLVKQLGGADKFTHPKNRWSVVTVNERNLEIQAGKKGSAPQRVKWDSLKPLDQIVPMILYYLGDEEKARDIPLRERAANYINAAVYFMTFAGDNDGAREWAKKFADRAVNDMPSKKTEVRDTLYDLEFASDDGE